MLFIRDMLKSSFDDRVMKIVILLQVPAITKRKIYRREEMKM